MTISLAQSLLTRGSILTCTDCGATVTVAKKGELPAGWIISTWWPDGPEAGGQQIDVYCPEHDPVFDVPTEVLATQE